MVILGLVNPETMKARTQRFGLDVIAFVVSVSRHPVSDPLVRQLVRCATSVGANYRASCRAKSTADFINKMKIVEEEADESAYWLEMLQTGGFASPEAVMPLRREADELTAIAVASIKTTRANR